MKSRLSSFKSFFFTLCRLFLILLHIGSCTYIRTYFSSQFPPNATKPDMVLGTHMQPGSDHTHFCMPTAVAVAASGDFFVADGYCNSRVMKFNKDGKLIKIISMYHSPHTQFRQQYHIVLLEFVSEEKQMNEENFEKNSGRKNIPKLAVFSHFGIF